MEEFRYSVDLKEGETPRVWGEMFVGRIVFLGKVSEFTLTCDDAVEELVSETVSPKKKKDNMRGRFWRGGLKGFCWLGFEGRRGFCVHTSRKVG